LKSPAVYNFIYLSVENNIFGNRYVFKFYVNEKNFEKIFSIHAKLAEL